MYKYKLNLTIPYQFYNVRQSLTQNNCLRKHVFPGVLSYIPSFLRPVFTIVFASTHKLSLIYLDCLFPSSDRVEASPSGGGLTFHSTKKFPILSLLRLVLRLGTRYNILTERKRCRTGRYGVHLASTGDLSCS